MKVNLEKELLSLCARNKDGSFSTQYNRRKILTLAARELQESGFFNLSPNGIKPKHIETLIDKWKTEGRSAGTLKNRMSHLRWWAEKVGKPAIINRENSHYGIERRKYVTNISKAVQVKDDQLFKIENPRLRCSVELQKAFGLRREECLKFQPSYAIKEDRITLKASWTKGGKPRDVPITNEYQREILAKAKALAGSGSMIPKEHNYKQWLNKYTGAVSTAGLSKLHGLRHEYAQKRYRDLTGWDSPACGGPKSKELSESQKALDHEVRLRISQELGHEREAITAVYLGR